MSQQAVYDDDILVWSEQQAAALRQLARTPAGISNEIDWDNIAEEIECVGRSELAAVQSFIRSILVHVIKTVSASDTSFLLHWRKEVVAFHRDLLDRITPSMQARVDLDRLWRQAVKQTDADLAVHGRNVVASLPELCPILMKEILDPDLDFVVTADAVRRRMASD